MKFFPHPGLRRTLLISFVSLLVMECATQRDPSQVIKQTELPTYNSETEEEELHIPVIFQLKQDGSVEEVNMLKSSGDQEWDSMAVDSMLKWKFTAPPPDSEEHLVRKNVRVELLPQQVMNLGELVARNEDEANVLYSRLRAGINFEQLVRQASENSSVVWSGRYIENANTMDYPTLVSKVLIDLNVGEFSRPVSKNGEYVIYKRYGDNLP